MEQIVVDSSIIVTSFLESEDSHQRGREYINSLENGDCIFHLPMLVVVEVTAAIRRRAPQSWQAFLSAWKQNIVDWERDGKVVLYHLDRDRMEKAINIAQRYRLRGSDAVVASLAEELDMPLKTFDVEILGRFQRASV